MRQLAVGDIHGSFKALVTLSEYVPFKGDDVIVTLGDYVDRGPDSQTVLNWLTRFAERGNLIALRGNHEIMMLEARDSDKSLKQWLGCGGDATLASYSPLGDAGKLVDVPEEHWEFLTTQTRAFFETESHFFVHANAYPGCSLEDQPDFMLYWEPFHWPPRHESDKVMVCGHTPQENGRPLSVGHAVCIDTKAWKDGWLTCLDTTSGKYWQANQRGETRWDWLSNESAE